MHIAKAAGEQSERMQCAGVLSLEGMLAASAAKLWTAYDHRALHLAAIVSKKESKPRLLNATVTPGILLPVLVGGLRLPSVAFLLGGHRYQACEGRVPIISNGLMNKDTPILAFIN